MTDQSKGLLLGFMAVVMFGLTLPITRFISPYFEPVFIGLGRAVLACIAAVILLVVFKAPLPSYPQVKRLLVVALGVVIGFPLLTAWAMQSLPASHGGVVLGILPLATAAASRLVSDERPSLGFWLAGIIGSLLVVAYSLLQGGGGFLLADFALFAAVVSAALGYAVGGKLAKEMAGWQVICWALVIVFPVIVIPALYYAPSELQTLNTSVIVGFLYLALVSQLFGFFIWYKALAIGGIARVSQIQLIQPFVTIAVSAWALSEAIDLQTAIFAATVVAIVALGKRMSIHSKHDSKHHSS